MKLVKHVIILGVDGAGRFFEDATTPNFDRIFENGTKTFRAYASNPSISAECWGSLLLGVSPKLHGMTNESISSERHDPKSKYPSLFRRIRSVRPHAELGAFSDWYPIINGIVERNQSVCCCSEHDADMLPKLVNYVLDRKPDFLFVQLNSPDHVGHANGYGTPNHLSQITSVDDYIGQVYDAVQRAGIADETLFMVVADHGGTCDPRPDGTGYTGSHGGWTENEKLITFAAIGPCIRKGGDIIDMNIRDLAAITLFSMGIERPDFNLEGWTSQLPEGLFTEPVPPYIDISAETGADPRISRIEQTSEPVLG